jgi:hypothetical protein
MGEATTDLAGALDRAAADMVSGLGEGSTYSTSHNSMLFYTSSVVSRSELYRQGFVDNLLFPDYGVPYCITKTVAWSRDLGADTTRRISTSTNNTYYFDTLVVPSGSVAVMMLYDGDVTETAYGEEYSLKYNVTNNEISNTWTDYDTSARTKDFIEYNQDYWGSSVGRATGPTWNTTNLIYYIGRTNYDEAEKSYLKELFGTTDDSSYISSSAAEIFKDFVKDIYNAGPVSRTTFKATPNVGLFDYNLQPLSENEGSAATVGSSYSFREVTETIEY